MTTPWTTILRTITRLAASLATAGAVHPHKRLPPWVRTLIALAEAAAAIALWLLQEKPHAH